MSAPLVGTDSAANAVQRVSYSHDAMIDLIIAKPAITQNDIARHFGYTVPWVSRIRNSDAFLARLAERKGDLIDPSIVLSFEEKLKSLADTSLERIMEKLQQPIGGAGVVDTAMKALDLSTRALGYGAKAQNVAVQQNFVVAMPQKVVSAAEWAAMGRESQTPTLQMVEEVKAA